MHKTAPSRGDVEDVKDEPIEEKHQDSQEINKDNDCHNGKSEKSE